MNDGEQIQEGAAGAPEGAAPAEPTTEEVKDLYDELGIKAAVPTGKTKGRPKSSKVRAENDSSDDDGDSKPGRKNDEQSKGKSKNAPADAEDGDNGDDSDAKSKKVGKTDPKVQDKSGEADDGVRDDKSTVEKDSERGGEDDADAGAKGTGRAADDEGDSEEEGEDAEKGKRPGKSNPEVEKRFQKLTEEKRERDELIEKLQNELKETTRKQDEAKVAQEDPEYTIEDFRKVRDSEGNIIDLDPERAELAWRRWKDGYDQRAEQRNAEANRQETLEKNATEMSERMMRQSVEAYDTLSGLMDEFPQLVESSGQYDAEFAAEAMPVIKEAIIYEAGTEPGNAEGNRAVIVGMRLNPKTLLTAMSNIANKKRSLPLNGVNDNVEVRSNVNVPHGRSSDPTVNAANDLMKELKINKRF